MSDVTTRTDPAPLAICGNHEIAKILAAHIDAGKSDATAYCGPYFCDYQAVAISNQVNSGKGDAEALRQLMIPPELANAIATAINARARA